MAGFEIRHEVGLKATTEQVYQALTDVKKLAQWWTSDTRGTSNVGQTLEFWFDDFCQKMEVAALKPGELVRWKVLPDGMGEWDNTEIEFKLFEDEGQCMVLFSHSGWRSNAEMYPHCSTKWAVFMLSLKDLVEKGKGHPYPNDWPINHY